jgi:hypothetical protein
MSITFPRSDVPGSPRPNALTLTQQSTTGVVTSPFTGTTQIVEWPAEWWVMQLAFPPMKRTDAEAWIAFLQSMRGMSGTFLYGDPSYQGARGVATGTPLVNGANAAGSKTLATKGWTASQTGILKAGDYLQVGTGASTRLYKVLVDADSDATGNATLDIFPRLREALSDSASITLTNPRGTFRLMDNKFQHTVNVARQYGITFVIAESL